MAVMPNVRLDAASAHDWDSLNESVFLEAMFVHLRQTMGAAFDDHHFYVFNAANGAMPASAMVDHPRKVLICLSDESASAPARLGDHYLAVFKAYLPAEQPGKVFPLSLGYVRDVPSVAPRPIGERSIGIFFSGNLNANRLPLYVELHPWLRRLRPLTKSAPFVQAMRVPALKRRLRQDFSADDVRGRASITFTGGFKQGLSPAAYGQALADSKIVLCPPGFVSAETFRHVEAMRAGAVVVTEALPDTRLYRGAPMVRVDNWRQGLAAADALLSAPDELAALQRRSLDWYADVLSEAATARQIGEVLTSVTGNAVPEGVAGSM